MTVLAETWSTIRWTPPAAPGPDPEAEPESLLVRVDTGERIHYLDWGEPDPRSARLPPLLLVHGLAGTAWSWAPVARRLRTRCRVLAPDLRGHGLSDAPRTGYELDSLAYDLLTVLAGNALGPDAGGPPAVAAGHGFGAIVAAGMAGLRPGAVAGLALVDGGWEDLAGATGQSPAEFARGLGDPPEVLASLAAYLADRRDYDPDSWDADQERAARAAIDEKHAGHVAPVARRHVLAACVEAMFGYDPLEVLPEFPSPLLVAAAESGSADDEVARERLLALEEVVRARSGRGGPTRVVRYQSGHNVMRYRPGELAAELLGLLELAATSGDTQGAPA